jgi:hypothetical protein
MQLICIPKNVEFIDGSDFVDSALRSISVDPDNSRFIIDRGFLFDAIRSTAIRYFGNSRTVEIWEQVQGLGTACIFRMDVENVAFEAGSSLQRIDEKCFCLCPMESICIPRLITVLRPVCFLRSGLTKVTFEPGSQLTRIERKCFARCALKSIEIPAAIESIGESCFESATIETITL